MTWEERGQPELRTERLVLRPFHPSDVDDVFDYARREEWSRYHLPQIPFPYERSDAESFLEHVLGTPWEEEANWAVTLNGRVIGGTALSTNEGGLGELGYSISPDHWNRGVATEAARGMLDYAFWVSPLEGVEAIADARNVGSWRVMEKLGMRRVALEEGVRRDRTGAVVDQVRYQIARWQWTGG